MKRDYDALSESQQKQISEKLVQKLDNAVNTIAALTVAEQINKLPDPVTLDDEAAVKAARAAFDKLTEKQQTLLPAAAKKS